MHPAKCSNSLQFDPLLCYSPCGRCMQLGTSADLLGLLTAQGTDEGCERVCMSQQACLKRLLSSLHDSRDSSVRCQALSRLTMFAGQAQVTNLSAWPEHRQPAGACRASLQRRQTYAFPLQSLSSGCWGLIGNLGRMQWSFSLICSYLL